MIGIGILTTPNRDILKETYKEWVKFQPPNSKIIIENDVNFDGVAKSSNRLLAKLDDCEHLFLINDDVKPLVQDWYLPYIDSPELHLMYQFKLPNKPASDMKKLYRDGSIVAYSHTRGAFIYIHRSVLDVVGGFDEAYGQFGYEHPDFTTRIYNAGLTTHRAMDVPGSNKLLYCYDQDGKVDSSLTESQKRKANIKAYSLYRNNRESKDFKAYR